MRICIVTLLSAISAFSQNGMLKGSADRLQYGRGSFQDRIITEKLGWELGAAGMNQPSGFPKGFGHLAWFDGTSPKSGAKDLRADPDMIPAAIDLKINGSEGGSGRIQSIYNRLMALGTLARITINAIPYIDSDRYGSKFNIIFRKVTLSGTILWGRGYTSHVISLKKEWEGGFLPMH